MNAGEISPSGVKLLEYREMKNIAKDAKFLLEQKREILINHLTEVISKIREHRTRLNSIIEQCYSLLQVLEIEIGEFELERVVKSVKTGLDVEVLERIIMGVHIPSLKLKQDEKKGAPIVSFASTTLTFDELYTLLKEAIELIIIVAQAEVSAWRLAYEIRKTQRRANALEDVYIPEFDAIIDFIQDSLEEKERAMFFALKKFKRIKKSKTEGGNG
jgi:V/A-type H+-transporting ATPase subunit D